jgi:hypothetical protein
LLKWPSETGSSIVALPCMLLLREGQRSAIWSFEAHMMHRPCFLRHSFSSGRSFPSGPRTFERSGFLDAEDKDPDAAGVDDLEADFE